MSLPIGRRRVAKKIRKTVPALSTLTVDTVATSKFRGLKYFLSAWQIGGNSKSLDMRVQNNNGVISDTVSDRIGGVLSMSIGASISGSDTILEVTNPNGFALEIELFRFKLGGS